MLCDISCKNSYTYTLINKHIPQDSPTIYQGEFFGFPQER